MHAFVSQNKQAVKKKNPSLEKLFFITVFYLHDIKIKLH